MPETVQRTTARPLIATLTRDETQRLSDRCRREGTTVHGALCAAACFAVRHALSAERATQSLSCVSALNVRPLCNPQLVNARSVGGFVASCECTVDTRLVTAQPERFWEIARQCKNDVRAAYARAPLTAGLIAFISKPLAVWLRGHEAKRPNARQCTIEVSNLGRVELSPSAAATTSSSGGSSSASGVTVGGCVFAQHNHNGGPLFNFSVLTPSSTGCLTSSLNVCEELTAPGVASAVLGLYTRFLQTM